MNAVGPTQKDHSNPKSNEPWTITRKLNDGLSHYEPIINFIDYPMCLIDDLHLLLRITDKLFNLLLLKFIRIDKNDSNHLSKRNTFSKFIEFLESKCKIKNPYYITSKTSLYGKILFRTFNGNEILRIFSE